MVFKITNFFPGIGSYHLGTIPSLLLCYWTTLCYFVFTTPHGRVKRRRKTSLFLPLASSSTTAMTQWRRKMKSGRESFDLFTCVWTTCSHFQKFARNFFNFFRSIVYLATLVKWYFLSKLKLQQVLLQEFLVGKNETVLFLHSLNFF